MLTVIFLQRKITIRISPTQFYGSIYLISAILLSMVWIFCKKTATGIVLLVVVASVVLDA